MCGELEYDFTWNVDVYGSFFDIVNTLENICILLQEIPSFQLLSCNLLIIWTGDRHICGSFLVFSRVYRLKYCTI